MTVAIFCHGYLFFSFYFREKRYGINHFFFSIRACNSFKDNNSHGDLKWFSNLLSSSFLWLSEIGISESTDYMLSQSSSTNKIFSGILNCDISETSSIFIFYSSFNKVFFVCCPIAVLTGAGQEALGNSAPYHRVRLKT